MAAAAACKALVKLALPANGAKFGSRGGVGVQRQRMPSPLAWLPLAGQLILGFEPKVAA